MFKPFFALLGCLLLLAPAASAQSNAGKDPVLFSVAGKPVLRSEFDYIYAKTNGDKATYDQASLEEYLDLYIKFKLKVQRAREMQLDTIPALQQELAGYRRQLADSYLIDREVTDRLIREAYERQTEDVDISHILVPTQTGSNDTTAAYEKVLAAKAALDAGQDFAAVAKEYSGDQSVARNGGHIGYVTALFPNGFYALETAAYTLPASDKVHGPIRTQAGYHLLKVHGKRPARGQLEVAHILLRSGKDKSDEVIKARADSIYQALQGGADFGVLAKQYSQDRTTKDKDGYLGFFGINRYERTFEDAAFALTEDGQITPPTRTQAGYHLIKRISKKEQEALNLAEARLEAQIKKDARFAVAKAAMIDRIKREAGFAEFNGPLKIFRDTVGENFLTYKWKTPARSDANLLAFGRDFVVTMGDFTDYLGRNSRKRIRMGRQTDLKQAVDQLYADFVNEKALEYEEQQLDTKYPAFKSLMREYEEGILLFEATKLAVWDKAGQDTVGLQTFYRQNRDRYNWEERVVVTEYNVAPEARKELAAIRNYARNHSPAEVAEKFNTDERRLVTYQEKTYERGRDPKIDALKWKEGTLSLSEEDKRNQRMSFRKVERTLKPSPKTLDEARGYVVADYQDYLEQEWVTNLRNTYSVEVKDKVLRKMVQ